MHVVSVDISSFPGPFKKLNCNKRLQYSGLSLCRLATGDRMHDSAMNCALTIRIILGASIAIGSVLVPLQPCARAQEGTPYGTVAAQHEQAPPSNKQLANAAIDAKVEALLKQMTLEEKLG